MSQRGEEEGEVRGREAHTKANFQKGKINPACLWTRWSPGAGAQGRSGCLREGEEQAMRRAEAEEFHQLQPPPLPLPSPPLPPVLPGALPPLPPAPLPALAGQSVSAERRGEQVSLGVLSSSFAQSLPEALQGPPSGGGARSALRACVFG